MAKEFWAIDETLLLLIIVCAAAGTLLWMFNQIKLMIGCAQAKQVADDLLAAQQEILDLREQVANLQSDLKLEKERCLRLEAFIDGEAPTRPSSDPNPSVHSIRPQHVYFAPKYGHCWHADRNCQHLRRGAVAQLVPCSRCAPRHF